MLECSNNLWKSYQPRFSDRFPQVVSQWDLLLVEHGLLNPCGKNIRGKHGDLVSIMVARGSEIIGRAEGHHPRASWSVSFSLALRQVYRSPTHCRVPNPSRTLGMRI